MSKLGPAQVAVLGCLIDGNARTCAGVAEESDLTTVQVRAAMQGLHTRRLVRMDDTGKTWGREWKVTKGGKLAHRPATERTV